MSSWLGRETDKELPKRASLTDVMDALEDLSDRLEVIEKYIADNAAEKQFRELKEEHRELNKFLQSVVMTIIAKPTTAQLYAASKVEVPSTASVKEANKLAANGPRLPG